MNSEYFPEYLPEITKRLRSKYPSLKLGKIRKGESTSWQDSGSLEYILPFQHKGKDYSIIESHGWNPYWGSSSICLKTGKTEVFCTDNDGFSQKFALWWKGLHVKSKDIVLDVTLDDELSSWEDKSLYNRDFNHATNYDFIKYGSEVIASRGDRVDEIMKALNLAFGPLNGKDITMRFRYLTRDEKRAIFEMSKEIMK